MHFKKRVFNIISSSKFLVTTAFIVNDLSIALSKKIGLIGTKSGTQTNNMNLKQSYELIKDTYEELIKDNKIDIKNKSILEVGPGDNLGLALLMIAKGAKNVICIDAFYPQRDKKKELKLYKYIIEQLKGDEKKRAETTINFTPDSFSFKKNKIQYICNEPLEKFKSKEKFDIIISKCVFEHLYDVEKGLENSNKLLNKEGKQIHIIDTSDHEMFSTKHSPYEWLKVKKNIWKLMTKNSGHPNRTLLPKYEQVLNKLNLKYDIIVTKIYGNDNLNINKNKLDKNLIENSIKKTNLKKHKTKFIKPYSTYTNEDLIIKWFTLIIKK